MTKDRKYNKFRLIKEPTHLSPQAVFIYKKVIELSGGPGKTRWLTFTEVVHAVDGDEYKKLLDPNHRVEVPDSVQHWLNLWSRNGYMERA